MTNYHPHGVKLSQNQKDKLVKAIKTFSAITLRLSKNEVTGPDELMLTKTQIKRLMKAQKWEQVPN